MSSSRAVSRKSLKKRTAKAFMIDDDLYDALKRAADGRQSTISSLLRRILDTWLREQGWLPRLKSCREWEEGRDVKRFPWSPTYSKTTCALVWFSDTSERTWERCFNDMEHETKTPLQEIASRYGVTLKTTERAFRMYDRWRRGIDPCPRIDLALAMTKLKKSQRGKSR
jgi:predicted CopG family antitoxin